MIRAMSEEECEEQRTLEYTSSSCFAFDENRKMILKYDIDNCPKDVVVPEEIDGVKVEVIGPGAFANTTSQECRKEVTYTDVSVPLDYIHEEGDGYTFCYYNVDDSKYITSVKLPYNLKKIRYSAFYYSKITDLTIPYGVTVIENNAFELSELTKVDIPNSVETIEHHAFSLTYLERVTIPDSVTTLDSYAFFVNNLKTVEIGSGLTNMGDNPFCGNTGITSLTVSPNNPVYKSENNAIYTKDGTTLVVGTKSMSNNIPSTVTTIAEEAFDNMGLTSLTIPSNVTTIGEWAFAYNNLTSVVIPDTVTSLGVGAFESNSLNSVTISNSITEIKDRTFAYNNLTSVDIPDTITKIGEGAFIYNRLTSVLVPNSVTSIGSYGFRYNYITEGNAQIDNYGVNVSLASGVFAHNGPGRNITILPRFLRD